MIRRFYADIAATRTVICVLYMDDPDEGPPSPPVFEGVECQYIGTSFVWDAPSDTSQPTWPVGALGIVWVEIAGLDDLKARKIEMMREACSLQILGGFESSALGAAYTYPANPTDQTNLIASVTDSLMPSLPVDWTTTFWCRDAAGMWEMRIHTAAQIQQVGRDGKAAILAAITKNEGLRQQIVAALAPADLDGIQW